MACISALFSPVFPKTSTTSPTMRFDSREGHWVMRTTALSPVFPPFSLRLGMMMSLTNILLSVIKKAISFSTFSFPTNVSRACDRISVTIASLIWLRRRAISDTLTRSPFMAKSELRSETNMGLSLPSGKNEFLPFDLRTKTPSCTCPFVFNRYWLSDTFDKTSSQAISSITSTANIFAGWVSKWRALNICLKLNVSFGCDWKNPVSISETLRLLRRTPPLLPFPIVPLFLIMMPQR